MHYVKFNRDIIFLEPTENNIIALFAFLSKKKKIFEGLMSNKVIYKKHARNSRAERQITLFTKNIPIVTSGVSF